MGLYSFSVKPAVVPELDLAFCPVVLENKMFLEKVRESSQAALLVLSIERENGLRSSFRTEIFAENSPMAKANFIYVERLVKTLLWIWGGWKITVGGSRSVGEYIQKAYSENGLRAFDAKFMSRVYERPFTVEITSPDLVPESNEGAKAVGRHLQGCRIGFDAGGSDRKVSAVIDGKAVYSEEVIWHPKTQSNPEYHYNEILAAMKAAATHMPCVDAIGISSAGIYIDNRIMAASLFINVSEADFNAVVKDMYLNVAKEIGDVPVEVANDGDVTALAGAMDLEDTNVLGIAMGTSEAGGYVDSNGNITGWLNELAFVPVDLNAAAAVDEWSGDYGCGVKYFSQDAVIKLAPAAGIKLDETLTPAEKLKVVQEMLANNDERAIRIFRTIGCYLGYGIAHYADFYNIRHMLVLGRVTSGEGGSIVISKAKEVLDKEFPGLAERISLHLPDESNRRVGQSIAAASLPEIKKV